MIKKAYVISRSAIATLTIVMQLWCAATWLFHADRFAATIDTSSASFVSDHGQATPLRASVDSFAPQAAGTLLLSPTLVGHIDERQMRVVTQDDPMPRPLDGPRRFLVARTGGLHPGARDSDDHPGGGGR